ncbi:MULTISPECIES: DNA polymerase III subunit delta [Lactobacillus]|uniref:DNA polymerase III subunit delta n=1 Tax=Lactobacillus xujianguonis TaxID=2495899 RepID=A0A437SWU1_9LACO|nr:MULTISPECIES: DNA polymerase III subunit delta [Lactobacillus]RVU71395.1 DNA polymerase III subunit delta [Lactobacillus xujianguonis]RVU76944.1 DNA polymerase III subunit delta [Lactobacillus xujianguonis]
MIDINNIAAKQAAFLKQAYENKQLAHSYLFVDRDEVRALNTAYWLACLFNCTGEEKPDGKCQNCQQILSGNHPDVLLVQPEGKQSLGIDQIRPLKEELAKSPVESSRRFFFINEAQKLTLPAANALLNLLEEPVAPVVSILITNNADQILPTVRSRTQIINFNENEAVAGQDLLLANGFSQDEIDELGDTKKFDQDIKYFYQELLEKNNLSFVSAHQLADFAKTLPQQEYLLIKLKMLAQKDLSQESTRLAGTYMLKCLIDVDKMRFSNVNFRNLLDYLALQWKR